MRRVILMMLFGGALAATTALGGCPAAHDDYPGLACKVNSDCYQGEICNGTICVPNDDLSIEGDFAHPPLDFTMPTDGMPDDLTPGDM
ncbi:MAG: hypothetical protein ACXVCV_05865 [Polyangia bacterium]